MPLQKNTETNAPCGPAFAGFCMGHFGFSAALQLPAGRLAGGFRLGLKA